MQWIVEIVFMPFVMQMENITPWELCFLQLLLKMVGGEANRMSFDELLKEASETESGCNKVIFLPYLMGELQCRSNAREPFRAFHDTTRGEMTKLF